MKTLLVLISALALSSCASKKLPPDTIVILEKLSEGEFRLQEYCDLGNYVKPESEWRNSDFWWDIDEDWFFWRFTPDFDKKFLDALNEKIQVNKKKHTT